MAWSVNNAQLGAYARLIRLDRPIGIWLLLWPTLWGLWLAAGGWPEGRLLAVFVGGVILMRSAGCAINDYADRHLDPHVTRTRSRPLAAGEISPAEALMVAGVLLIGALILALMLPVRALWLALPAAALVLTYPYAKRLHSLPQLHLGMCFAWSVPMAITATTEAWPQPWGWWLFAATVLWVIAYDTLYAMADRTEDLAIGSRSSAILFGTADRVIVGILQSTFLTMMAVLGVWRQLDAVYFAGVLIAGSLIVWQWWRLRNPTPDVCLWAFTHNAWVGAVLWIALAWALPRL